MRTDRLQNYGRAVVAAAQGGVLEVAVGSGLNFSFYGEQVEIVYGIDPSPRLLAMARRRAGVRAALLQASAAADLARRPSRRRRGDDLDAVLDPGCAGGVTRDAARAQSGRQATLRRARTFAGARSIMQAEPAHSGLVPCRGRLSPRPQDGRSRFARPGSI